MQYTMIRTRSAGVFAGYIKSQEHTNSGICVVATNARRIWYWDGAASLSQLAIDGPQKPENCKFPEAVAEVTLAEVIEMIPITDKAKEAIDAVPVWKF